MRDRIRGRFYPLSDYQLESFLCDELGPSARAEVERAAAVDAELSNYLRRRRQQAEGFAELHPLPESLLSSPVSRPWHGRARPSWLAVPAVAAAAVVLGVVLRPRVNGPARPSAATAASADTVRVKGNGLRAQLFVKRAGRVFLRKPGESLLPHDEVRLALDTVQPGNLTLLARDASGRVTVYYDGLPITAGRYLVPDSLRLDASVGEEEWLLVLSPDRLPASHYVDLVRRGESPRAAHLRIPITVGPGVDAGQGGSR